MTIVMVELFLRLLYVDVNSCPRRILCASDKEFYITLDQILSPVIEIHSDPEELKEPNLLLDKLSIPFQELLQDVFQLPGGPRLRDKVSHGEVCILSVTSDLTLKTLNMLQLTSAVYSSHSAYNKDLLLYLEKYRGLYHPHTIVERNIINCLSEARKWTHWDRVSRDLLDYPQWPEGESEEYGSMEFKPLFSTCCTKTDGNLQKIHIIHRPRIELEVSNLLNRVVCCCKNFLSNLKQGLKTFKEKFVGRQLSSRRRETYRRLLSEVPVMLHSLIMLLNGLNMTIKCINNISNVPTQQYDVIKKTFKQILKNVENIVSFSSASSNKWSEALKLSENNTKLLENVFRVSKN